MRRLPASLLAISLLSMCAPATAAIRPACRLQALQFCTDTNQLVSQKDFWKQIRRFVGSRRGDYIAQGESVYEQFGDLLGGPPDDRLTLDGEYVFGAAEYKAGFIRGAAILDPNGSIDALAFVSPCGHPEPFKFCSAKYTLTVFSRVPVADTRFGGDIQRWATGEVAKTSVDPTQKSRLTAVHFIVMR